MKNQYKGWIIIDEKNGNMTRHYVEYSDSTGERKREFFQSPQEAVEWWDKRLGAIVSLMPTLKGCYRVYVSEFEQ